MMSKAELFILLMGASIAVYGVCLAWILFRVFQNDKKSIKKIIGMFFLGILV